MTIAYSKTNKMIKTQIRILSSSLLLCFTLISFSAFSVPGTISSQAHEKYASQKSENLFIPFNAENSASKEELYTVVKNCTVLKATADIKKIINNQPEFIKLKLPINDGLQFLEVILYKVNISPNGFKIITSSGESADAAVVNYRGALLNDYASVASFTFSENETMGLIGTASGNFVIGKIENDPSDNFMIYNDRDLIPTLNFECPTDVSVPQNYSQRNDAGQSVTTVKCVNWYWETDYDVFVNKGSSANVNTYMQGIFNQVSTLYANDGISITLQTLYIWTTTDPYTGPTTNDYLTQFGVNRTSFAGDLANLIGFGGGGGIAWINGLCNSQTRIKQAYCGINSTYNNVPTYSWTVEVTSHEQGHQLGSRHTHDCVWNGNNTRIDGCGPAAGYPSGSCAAGTIPVKGTIMSYCHLVSGVGIDLTLGFGPQPTALMINNVNNAACLSNCSTTCTPPAQPAAISGATNACQNTSYIYSIAAVATATSYTWTLPSGWNGTSTSNSITVIPGNAGGVISVTANNACGSSIARTFTTIVTTLPAQPGTITMTGGIAKICPGNVRTYTTSGPAGTVFNWTPPTGATITSGQGTASITVNYTAAFITSGTLSVVATNNCGNSTARTLTITRNTPGTPGAMTGTNIGLCGATNIIYSVPNVSGMTYTWTVPAGVTIVSGQGSNSIAVNFPSTNLTGSISVRANNACGAGAQRSITVRTIPATPTSITGNTVVCPNTAGNAFSITPIASASNYTWNAPAGSTITADGITSASNTITTTATSASVNLGALTATSRIQVRANNSCGSSSYRNLNLTQGTCRIADEINNGMIVQPNPAHDKTTVVFSSEKTASLRVYVRNISGKTIYSGSYNCIKGNNQFEIDLKGYSKGIYIISLEGIEMNKHQKMEVQ